MLSKSLREGAARVSAGDATSPYGVASEGWWPWLEIIGAELFQRYRKRLMSPGIALEIRRDYPGLSLPDIMLRVHAGRRILQDGDDFRALAAIRNGRWQCHLAAFGQSLADHRTAGDRFSRWLVRLGGLLFVAFCTLPLIAALPDAAGDSAARLSVYVAALGVSAGWWLVPCGVRRGWISRLAQRWVGTGTAERVRATDQRDAASSV